MVKKEKQLFEACKTGNIKQVKKSLGWSLFSKKTNIEAEDSYGSKKTPLWIAAFAGHKEIVEFLISKNANIEANKEGLTPVMVAAQKGYVEIAKILVQHKADINRFGSVMVIGDVNVSVTTTTLILAVQNSHSDMVSFLLEHGADVNSTDLYSDTALHHAVKQNNIEIAKLLISKNPDLNTKNNKGYTPLIMAVIKRQLDMIELLANAGSDVNIKSGEYKSAFDYAKSSPRITEILQKSEVKTEICKADKLSFPELCTTVEMLVNQRSHLVSNIHIKANVIDGTINNELILLGFNGYLRENITDSYMRTQKYELIFLKTDEYDYEMTWLATHITGINLIEIGTQNEKTIKPKGLDIH